MFNEQEDLLDLISRIAANNNMSEKDVMYVMEQTIKITWEREYGPGYELSVVFKPKQIKIFRVLKVVPEVFDHKIEVLGNDVGTNILEDVSEQFKEIKRSNAKKAENIIKEMQQQIHRSKEYDTYKDQVGKLIICKVKKNRGRQVLLSLSGIYEGELISSGELYLNGETVKALLKEVRSHPTRCQLVLERNSPEFLRELIISIVPEIERGKIEILAIAREAGSLSKVMVRGEDKTFSPVSVCIGMNANRLKSIMQELKNEKLDFVEYDEKIEKRVLNCFYKIPIQRVYVSVNSIEVVVKNDKEGEEGKNFRNAIGRRGQNCRLISKLLNRDILILTEEQDTARKEERAIEIANQLKGIGFEKAKNLAKYYHKDFHRAVTDNNLTMEELQCLEEYLDKKDTEDLERFINLGGEKNLFRINNNFPNKLYFELLEVDIRTVKDLLRNNEADLYELVNLDMELGVHLLESAKNFIEKKNRS